MDIKPDLNTTAEEKYIYPSGLKLKLFWMWRYNKVPLPTPEELEVIRKTLCNFRATQSDEVKVIEEKVLLVPGKSKRNSKVNRNLRYLEQKARMYVSPKDLREASTSYAASAALSENNKSNTTELVAIGPNGTTLPKEFLETLDWSSGPKVTRQILSQMFDKKTLATHSLTGRPSPAFRDRVMPEKKPLDPRKIEDIVHAVTELSNCSARDVRSAITTKCADENKILKKKRKHKEVEE